MAAGSCSAHCLWKLYRYMINLTRCNLLQEDSAPAMGPAVPPIAEDPLKRTATKAMGVTDFMDKGVGGAQLPRKRQDRKDKEKSKRAMGQSSHASWKSEAEMLLRQQYDS